MSSRRRGSAVAALALVMVLLAGVVGTVGSDSATAAGPPSWRPFKIPVSVSDTVAYDPSRWTPARTAAPAHPGRSIRLEVYAPVGLGGKLPTVLFAPGNNVGPDFDALMLNSMASAGFLVIGIDFPGSTGPNASGGPLSRDLVNNALDMSFVLSWLAQQPQWAQRIDFSSVAAAGHSDGAISVSALALNSNVRDTRFAAYVEMSGGMDGSFGGTWGPSNEAPLLTTIGSNDEFGARPVTLATWNVAAWPKTLIDVAGGNHWQMYTQWSHQGDAVRGAIVEWLNLELRHDPAALGPFWYNASILGVSANTASANAIDSTYGLLNTWRSPLGAQKFAVGPDPRGYGTVGYYNSGAIYDTPGLGTNIVWGAIWADYQANNTVLGPLGYPTSSELFTAVAGGRYQTFQGGRIFWSPASGAHVVRGAIGALYASLGSERGSLGFPTTDETPTPARDGAYNHFQGGSIYWSPSTGAHTVSGPVRNLWASLGWEKSWLGYPTAEPRWAGPSVQAPFQHGTVYSSSSGTFALSQAVADRYVLSGGAGGTLGVPVGSTIFTGSTQTSRFSKGTITVNTAAATVTVQTASGTTTGPVQSLAAWAGRAYQEILERAADSGGVANVTERIRKGASLLGAAAGLAHSSEARALTITHLYGQVLHRQADQGGRNWATWELARGRRAFDIAAVLGGSTEFWVAGGRTNVGFLDLAYQRFYGRHVDPAGLAYWNGILAGGRSRVAVAGALANSTEAAHVAVTGVYSQVFGRPADSAGLSYWATWWRSHGGDTVSLTATFVATTEFSNR